MIHISSIPNYDCDVLIVGAGPGGTALATSLAQADISVIIIEAHSFPRDKVCGDFVGPVAIAELQKLGIAGLEDFPKTNVINKAAVYLDGKEIINRPIPRKEGIPFHGRVIPRMTLDYWLFKKAKEAGARVFEKTRFKSYTITANGVKAEITTQGKNSSLRAKMIVGADGSSSTVARIFYGSKPSNFDRILAVRAYYENISGPQDQCELYFTEASFPGYYWLFPTGKHTANIGVGMVMETLPKNETHLNELLNKLIQEDESLKQRIGTGTPTGKIQGWPLATYNPTKDIISDRLVLIGDAAGLINSLNGEGIQYALLSGRWAADTIKSCIAADDFSKAKLQSYDQKVAQELRYDLALSNTIIQCIRNRKFNPFWMELLSIMVSRAKIDESYADIAGGILAGMEPANKAIHPSFITKTLVQGAVHFGLKSASGLLKGPSHWVSAGARTGQFVGHMAKEIKNDPKAYTDWVMGLAANGIEISSHIWRDLHQSLSRNSKNHKNNGKENEQYRKTKDDQSIAKVDAPSVRRAQG
ncbi:MAG: geranylgeranyl reductase [Cytophagaceae bacterium]|nr:geranylgeranyl reductase [Cytophagaceae bacterium]